MTAQDYGGDDRVNKLHLQRWRAGRVKRFTESQQLTREWINFAEIAEWCSKEDQSILPNKEKRAAAFGTLANDLLAGEFEKNGRSRVLYLHPATARARMTREWLKDVIENNYDNDLGRSQYLAHCWVEQDIFEQWLEKHRLTNILPRFQAAVSRASRKSITSPTRAKPKIQNAQEAIKELYPAGVPDQTAEPNKNLIRRVSAWLKESRRHDVSNDTILRAAGRRKRRK